MSALDRPTTALVRVALGLFAAPAADLERRFVAAREAGTSVAWQEELVLAAVLFVGFPRALVAAAALRAVAPPTGDGSDAADYERWRDWLARGEETCRRIYGAQYDKLRRNVASLHPALDRWIVVDGYGRTLSRPALDLRRRELCSIAMLLAQDAPRQLHSHFRGALNVGAGPEEVEEVLNLAVNDESVPHLRSAEALVLWRGMVRG
jgi:4-carboxymuconolactone decarboxylase